MNPNMHCPICKVRLEHHSLPESQVPAYRCPNCEGIWISSNEYLRWVKDHPSALPPKLTSDPDLPDWDIAQLKLCPGCGHFLTRFRLLPHTHFFVDRCSSCNGVWLDRNEWDVLVEHNLHDKLNDVFTKPWQAKIREAEARETLESLYLEKFGADDYRHLQEIRDWLMQRPQRAMMLAFLQSEDPYRIR